MASLWAEWFGWGYCRCRAVESVILAEGSAAAALDSLGRLVAMGSQLDRHDYLSSEACHVSSASARLRSSSS